MSDRPDNDPLVELLRLMRVSSWIYANPRVCGRWRLDSKVHGAATFHFVVRGTAWLHIERGIPPTALRAGDLVVFPRDVPHALSGEFELPEPDRSAAGVGAGAATDLVCGQFDLLEPAASMLLDSLPAVLVIDGEAAIPGLSGLGRLLASEADTHALGRQLVLERLSDVLFVAILRYVVASGRVTRGVLAGLGDPGVSRALAAMTGEPGAAWTLATLAARAGMSRTVFAQQFARLVGEPPISWLTRLRMERGAALLDERSRSVGEVAEALGYRTEAAFRRAFKRSRGIGPGAHRRGGAVTPENPRP